MTRGEIWWVDFGDPIGSEPGYKRPAFVIQNNKLNDTRLATTIVLPITSNLTLKDIKGNVFLDKNISMLSKNSVILAHQIVCVDKNALLERVSCLTDRNITKLIEKELLFVLGCEEKN
ncbi:MAG: type II toxin-antitoxin system PemK/MazF family toxin [Chitinispirillales bacterium]|jgi:mRNA interferase MazF|nr:type II toxin-antitoxin system PemK/MazF family toxin [Chitinispirillales bacterium]